MNHSVIVLATLRVSQLLIDLRVVFAVNAPGWVPVSTVEACLAVHAPQPLQPSWFACTTASQVFQQIAARGLLAFRSDENGDAIQPTDMFVAYTDSIMAWLAVGGSLST